MPKVRLTLIALLLPAVAAAQPYVPTPWSDCHSHVPVAAALAGNGEHAMVLLWAPRS